MTLPNLAGRSILITGGTNGIGLEAAVALAGAGANVSIVGRDPARTAAAVADIKSRANSDLVDSFLCDFADPVAIRALAASVRTRLPQLHVLVNNAGTVHAERTVTAGGIEATFAVNHLGYFLLTQLLLDVMIASAPARVVIVSSTGHYQGTLNFEDIGFEKGYSIMAAYRRSKLANVLYARSLAKKLAGTGVTVNALHPGGVATNIWTGAPGWAKPLLTVAQWFMLTPAQGAERITYLAASADVAEVTGGYFHDNVQRTPSLFAQDAALGDRLWTRSEQLVGLNASRE